VSGDGGASQTPWAPDVSVLIAVARDDQDVMSLIQNLDALGRPLVISVLAMTAASLDMRTGDTEPLLHGITQLGNAMTAPLADAEQAVALAGVISRTGLDPWDAHVAAIADVAVCPILTLDAAKWRPHLHDLDEALHIVEIGDP
jgi:predicted nucleic acid-binding protein